MRNMPPSGTAGYDEPTWPDPATPQPPQAQPGRPARQSRQTQPAPVIPPVPPVYGPPPYAAQPAPARPFRGSSSAVARMLRAVAQLVGLALGIVELLLIVRLVLLFFGANPAAQFTSVIYGWTDPLVAPFQGVFPNVIGGADHVIDAAAILAIIVYAIGARVAEAILRLLARI